MSEAIVWIVTLLIVGGGLWALQYWLANVNRQRAEMTEEEYQENLARDTSALGAGLVGLDEFLRPEMKKAIEYRRDAERGQLPGGGSQGKQFDDDDQSRQL
jgi:hypothetical protein